MDPHLSKTSWGASAIYSETTVILQHAPQPTEIVYRVGKVCQELSLLDLRSNGATFGALGFRLNCIVVLETLLLNNSDDVDNYISGTLFFNLFFNFFFFFISQSNMTV